MEKNRKVEGVRRESTGRKLHPSLQAELERV